MTSRKNILVGDIGGTNIRLGLASIDDKQKIHIENIVKIPCDGVDDFSHALAKYIREINQKPENIALAVAGAIKNNFVKLTNRNWVIDGAKLKHEFGFASCDLYNDFSAMARSIPELKHNDFVVLNNAKPDINAPLLVAGPGTGFGMASLIPVNNNGKISWKVLSGEGGHQAYAPQNEIEVSVLKILQKKHSFVSLEMVSAGIGFDRLHKAVCENFKQEYKSITPKQLKSLALAGDDIAKAVCEIRACAIMGALGDMALAIGARGGVVLAGGVVKNLVEFIDSPKAMARFFNRGVMADYVKNINIKLLTKPAAALYGVAGFYFKDNMGLNHE